MLAWNPLEIDAMLTLGTFGESSEIVSCVLSRDVFNTGKTIFCFW